MKYVLIISVSVFIGFLIGGIKYEPLPQVTEPPVVTDPVVCLIEKNPLGRYLYKGQPYELNVIVENELGGLELYFMKPLDPKL